MAGDYLILTADGPFSVDLPSGGSLLYDQAASGKGVWMRVVQPDGSVPVPGMELTYEEYDKFREDHPDLDLPEMKPPGPGEAAEGNTVGRVVGDTPAAEVPAEEANPEVAAETEGEATLGAKVLDGVQIGLDVVGLIPLVGEVADLVNAGISALRGDYLGAALSLASAIPFAGWFGAGAKFARRGIGMADEVAGAVVKQADEVAEAAAKQADELAEAGAKQGDEVAEAGAKQGDEAATANNAQVKKANKLKCGDRDSYGELKKKPGDNQFDRDHVPSKAALLERAEQLARQQGVPFTGDMKTAIIQLAEAVAIPKASHRGASPTYGQRGKPLIVPDAADLKGAVQRDLNAMLGELRTTDLRCYEKYKRFASKLMRALIENKDVYDDFLLEVLKG